MMKPARWFLIGLVPLGLTLVLLAAVRSGQAADDENKQAQDLVLKLIDTMAKGDADATKAQAKDIADKFDDLEPVMHIQKPKDDGGIGVAGAPPTVGIEKKVIAMAEKPLTADEVATQSAALEQMAKTTAAIAVVAQNAKVPKPTAAGAAPPAGAWAKWSKEMQENANDLAKAAKAKDADAVAKAVSKLNGTCMDCHKVYKD